MLGGGTFLICWERKVPVATKDNVPAAEPPSLLSRFYRGQSDTALGVNPHRFLGTDLNLSRGKQALHLALSAGVGKGLARSSGRKIEILEGS